MLFVMRRNVVGGWGDVQELLNGCVRMYIPVMIASAQVHGGRPCSSESELGSHGFVNNLKGGYQFDTSYRVERDEIT